MSIEMDMFLILKKAQMWKEQIEQEKEFFGSKFAQFTKFMESYYPSDNDILESYLIQLFGEVKEGSDRFGVDLGDYFIKVARSAVGIELNKREANIIFNVFPKVYNRCPNFKWIMVEKAEDFTESSTQKFFPEVAKEGLYLDEYFDALDEGLMEINEEDNRGERIYKEENNRQIEKIKRIEPQHNLKRFLEFFHSYPQASSDLGNENLGIVIRDGEEIPVLIDAGLHGDLVPASTRGVKKQIRERVGK